MSQMNEVEWLNGILADKKLIAAIARKTRNTSYNLGRHAAIYEGESTLYVVSDLQDGWTTRGNEICFYEPKTRQEIIDEITEYRDNLIMLYGNI